MIGNKLGWMNFYGNKNVDYNELSNKPIKRVVGTMENPIKLWKLANGLYLLEGFVQHTNAEIARYLEKEDLFVSVTTETQEDKHIVSCFVPFWESQYDYTLAFANDEKYIEHQIVKILMEGDVKVPSKLSELENDCDYVTEDKLNFLVNILVASLLSYDEEGNLVVTINDVVKKFKPIE